MGKQESSNQSGSDTTSLVVVILNSVNREHGLMCKCGMCCVDQLQQLSSQPNGQTRIDAERKLQKQKQDLDQQLSQKAQQLLQLRLVRCVTVLYVIVLLSFVMLCCLTISCG